MASKTRPMAILLLGALVSCYAGSDRQTGGVAIVELPPGGAVAVKPTGVAARWAISTFVPTVIRPSGRCGSTASLAAFSTRWTMSGVAKTAIPSSPHRRVLVSSVTSHSASAVSPTFKSVKSLNSIAP